MKFFEDILLQEKKRRHFVCGDFYLCARTPEATTAILCDGIGSGIYANISAITCGNRLMALLEGGRSLRSACEHVAESMNRARTEEAPFAAFIAVRILPGGQFTAYAYENPGPILIRHGAASVCRQQFIALKYEMIAEAVGTLEEGDSLLLCSDGVTHAGLGSGFATGWEIEGVAREITSFFRQGNTADKLLPRIMHTVYTLSGKAYWDDTSIALLTCREASQLAILTGPPKNRSDDKRAIEMFMEAPGKKIISGSTTTDVASRELKRKARIVTMDVSLDRPPEYTMEGIDLITEGAISLNQAMNLLEEDGIDFSANDSPISRLCRMLLSSDVITFFMGGGYNAEQHEDTLFQQLGVKPRKRVVRRIADHLRQRGKLVTVKQV